MKKKFVICELATSCKKKNCFHKNKHVMSDACKGLCMTQGIANCKEVAKDAKNNSKR